MPHASMVPVLSLGSWGTAETDKVAKFEITRIHDHFGAIILVLVVGFWGPSALFSG